MTDISAKTLSITFAGTILLWSGVKGKSWSTVLRDLLSGINPEATPTTNAFGTGGGGSGGAGTAPPSPASAAATKSIFRMYAASYGWVGAEWVAIEQIVGEEDASWDVHATNPNGGAYGVPQALPGSKMASAGPDWQNSAATQAKWMMAYIKGRYGDPIKAQQFHLANGWY